MPKKNMDRSLVGDSRSVGVEDMIKMDNLVEEEILSNLRIRYSKNLIYTNTGSILVSVNPYKPLPIYRQSDVHTYVGKSLSSPAPPPHVFRIAESAYYRMVHESCNQSVIISGESGAGKTEATKLILQYLAAMTNKHTEVEQKILESSPVLEAFGNAKTVRNNNSSRFGKFIEIHFGGSNTICGARIVQYLLERSRVVHQSEGERNYHVFYALCCGCSRAEKAKYHLLDHPKEYRYLNGSGCFVVEGLDEEASFERLKMALQSLNLGGDTQDCIFSILSGLLLLGNVEFRRKGDSASAVSNPKVLKRVAGILKVDPSMLEQALGGREMTVRGTKFNITFSTDEAEDARDALAKAIYAKLFEWLVHKINQVIYRPDLAKRFIGVLDIFGFENFKSNSFEQFCINYANEKLQQFFNETIFKIEQKEYMKEEITWDKVDFTDNADTIELIEGRMGIFSLLDEECRFPKASDKTLLEKLHSIHSKHSKYTAPRRSRTSFIVTHYAGDVQYQSQGFLDKNRDVLPDNLVAVLMKSELDLLPILFKPNEPPENVEPNGGRGRATMRKKPNTVGGKFKKSLLELMSTLQNTSPHYVRCIKPNAVKAADSFDDEMVVTQLRYAGMLETIRIRRMGYPVRYSFDAFVSKYRHILPHSFDPGDAGAGIRSLLQRTASERNDAAKKQQRGQDPFQVGLTKAFLKNDLYAALQAKLDEKLSHAAVVLQSVWRMYWVRMYYLEVREGVVLLQAAIRMHRCRASFQRQRRAAIVVQARIRGHQQKKRYQLLLLQKKEEERLAREKERIRREKEEKRQREEEKRRRKEDERKKKEEEKRKRREEEKRKRREEEAEKKKRTTKKKANRIELEERKGKTRDEHEEFAMFSTDADESVEQAVVEEVGLDDKATLRKHARRKKGKRGKRRPRTDTLSGAAASSSSKGTSTHHHRPQKGDTRRKRRGDASTPTSSTSVDTLRPRRAKGEGDGAVPWSDGKDVDGEEESKGGVRSEEVEKSMRSRRAPLQIADAPQVFPEVLDGSEISEFLFLDFASKYFRSQTRGRVRKRKMTIQEVASFGHHLSAPLVAPSASREGKLALLMFMRFNAFLENKSATSSQGQLLTGYSLLYSIFSMLMRNAAFFRDEWYCQMLKQATHCPSVGMQSRVWEVISLTCGVLPPSNTFAKYLASFLLLNKDMPGEVGVFAREAYAKLKKLLFSGLRPRREPPSVAEMKANARHEKMDCVFTLLDGRQVAVKIDSLSTATHIFKDLVSSCGVRDATEFAIYEVYYGKQFVGGFVERSLTRHDHLADVFSKIDQFSRSKRANRASIVFKKKLRLDPKFLSGDAVEDKLEMCQTHLELSTMPLVKDIEVAMRLAALKLFVDSEGGDEDVLSAIMGNRNALLSYIPAPMCAGKPVAHWSAALSSALDKVRAQGPADAVQEYLKVAKALPMYGWTMYRCRNGSPAWDLPDELYACVGVRGVWLMDVRAENVLRAFHYAQLDGVKFQEKSVTFSFAGEPPLMLETLGGVEIFSIIVDYMYWLRSDSNVAVAQGDYEVNDDRLLGFRKGESITITKKDPSGWWTGVCGERSGVFPEAMVELVLVAPRDGETGYARARGKNARHEEGGGSSPRTKPAYDLAARRRSRSIGMMAEGGPMALDPRARGRRGSGAAVSPHTSTSVAGGARRQSRRMSGGAGPRARAGSIVSRSAAITGVQYPFIVYAKEHLKDVVDPVPSRSGAGTTTTRGRFKRKPRMERVDVSRMVAFTKDPIRDTLTKIPAEDLSLRRSAVDAFRLLMKYMGDYPLRSGGRETRQGVMAAFAQLAIDGAKLRDELVCQMIKQTSGNRKPDSLIRGWEMLSVCSGLFMPSRALQPYVHAYYHDHASVATHDDKDVSSDITALAKMCLHRLDRLKSTPPRMYAPSIVEFNAVTVGPEIPIVVQLMDGTQELLVADMASTFKELSQRVLAHLGLSGIADAQAWHVTTFRGGRHVAPSGFGGRLGRLHIHAASAGPKASEACVNVCDALARWEHEARTHALVGTSPAGGGGGPGNTIRGRGSSIHAAAGASSSHGGGTGGGVKDIIAGAFEDRGSSAISRVSSPHTLRRSTLSRRPSGKKSSKIASRAAAMQPVGPLQFVLQKVADTSALGVVGTVRASAFDLTPTTTTTTTTVESAGCSGGESSTRVVRTNKMGGDEGVRLAAQKALLHRLDAHQMMAKVTNGLVPLSAQATSRLAAIRHAVRVLADHTRSQDAQTIRTAAVRTLGRAKGSLSARAVLKDGSPPSSLEEKMMVVSPRSGRKRKGSKKRKKKDPLRFTLDVPQLAEYIPENMASARSPDQWIESVRSDFDGVVADLRSSSEQLDDDHAQLFLEEQYLRVVREEWPLATASLFPVERKQAPTEVILAVGAKGLHLVIPTLPEPIFHWEYRDISNYAASEDGQSFSFYHGSLMNPELIKLSTANAATLAAVVRHCSDHARQVENMKAAKPRSRIRGRAV